MMESASNDTAPHTLPPPKASSSAGGDGNAYLYILIVMSFYAIFLLGITMGYLHSKRHEKRRTPLFTCMLQQEERLGLVMLAGRPPPLAPLACTLCSAEQSSVSSLCSAYIEEEEVEAVRQLQPSCEGLSIEP